MNQEYKRIDKLTALQEKEGIFSDWKGMEIPATIPQGDMPGDKIQIGEGHIQKANVIMPELIKKAVEAVNNNPYGRVVLTVCGGSGVGKSEIASLLSYYFNANGVGSYTLSGDNYPRRIPMYNDAERLKTFRESGVKALVDAGEASKEHFEILFDLQQKEIDADRKLLSDYPWLKAYLDGGREGLTGYLGTTNEINFAEVESIVSAFKEGADALYLKRMGRKEHELWYDLVDLSKTQVLIIEWTHGNSDNYQGVDIPVLLNSTPKETLAHRQARNRDGKTDSAFTTMVLEIEQNMLRQQAHKAKIIVAKSGELLSFAQYEQLMNESEDK